MEEEPLPSSSSGSLTRQSTQSTQGMDIDSVSMSAQDTPARTTSDSSRNTPLPENIPTSLGPLTTDAEKGIIVDTPSTDLAPAEMALENGFAMDDDDEDVVTPFPKRKRSSTANFIQEDLNYTKIVQGSPKEEPTAKRPKPVSSQPKIRGVIIGVWRDSDQTDDADKHVIFGFIDIHDRLRTRIYGMNRKGDEVIGNLPTGAGGCWVTFPRINFDPHLKSLSSSEIKEYVKIRSSAKPEGTPEERHDADMKAVLKAISIVANQEVPPPGSKPIPHRQSLGRQSSNNRQSLPRQPLTSTPSFKAVNANTTTPTPKSSPAGEAKSSGVLLGYWLDSSEVLEADKHAVYGVIGGSDCFRVKVQRITRDGRFVDGNFPVGAGALWLHYDKLVLEPQLSSLSRPQVKEYVRIRQRDIENKESEKDRKANEQRALREAKAVSTVNPEVAQPVIDQPSISPEMEVRHSARSELRMSARQQAEAGAAAEKIRKEKIEARERQHEKTRKDLAMAEAVIQEAAQVELKNNLKKLNKVWVAQQAATSPKPPAEEVKYHNGVKYERKQNGPFQGKLVSAAQILSIDGEDFVEYRVLTKPSFF